MPTPADLVTAPLHTPEPWRVKGNENGRLRIIAIGASGLQIAAVRSANDARLMAAAPALLAALEALFADYKELGDSGDAGFWSLEDQDVGKQAMAAIALARGEA